MNGWPARWRGLIKLIHYSNGPSFALVQTATLVALTNLAMYWWAQGHMDHKMFFSISEVLTIGMPYDTTCASAHVHCFALSVSISIFWKILSVVDPGLVNLVHFLSSCLGIWVAYRFLDSSFLFISSFAFLPFTCFFFTIEVNESVPLLEVVAWTREQSYLYHGQTVTFGDFQKSHNMWNARVLAGEQGWGRRSRRRKILT